MKRHRHWFDILLPLCFALAACGTEAPTENAQREAVGLPDAPATADNTGGDVEKALLIGVVGPESGVEAPFGESVRDGALLAIQKINESGGVAGQEVQVVHYDNESDPSVTSRIVEHLIEQNVLAIITAPTGWATFGPTHLANDSETILVSIGSRRRIARSGEYIFQLSLTDEIATDYLIDYARNTKGYARYALVSVSDYDYSLDIGALFKRALSKHHCDVVLESDTYDTYTGQHNVEKVVSELLAVSDELDAVIFTGHTSEAVQLAKGLADTGASVPILAGEDLFSDEFLQKGGSAIQGSLVYATFPDRNLVQTQEFSAEFLRHYSHPPDRFAALAFDATGLVVDAFAKSGSHLGDSIRRSLLETVKTNGVTGSTGFSEEGAAIKTPLIYEVVSVQDGVLFSRAE